MDSEVQIEGKLFKPINIDDVRPNIYYISEYEDIYSKSTNKILKQKSDKDGYLEISLRTTKNKGRSYRIHRLVAINYIGNPPSNMKDPTINHIDNNVKNNHYSNLEWMERNINSSTRKNKGTGELNHEAKLTETQVEEICDLLVNSDLTFDNIARLYNVEKSTVNNIKCHKNWKHITEKYDFSCRKSIRVNGKFKSINTNLTKTNNK